jgi:hypothetical protein
MLFDFHYRSVPRLCEVEPLECSPGNLVRSFGGFRNLLRIAAPNDALQKDFALFHCPGVLRLIGYRSMKASSPSSVNSSAGPSSITSSMSDPSGEICLSQDEFSQLIGSGISSLPLKIIRKCFRFCSNQARVAARDSSEPSGASSGRRPVGRDSNGLERFLTKENAFLPVDQ